VAFISVPLLLRHRADVGKLAWRVGVGLIAAGAAVQVASITFWLQLELYQMMAPDHPSFVIGLRFKNMVAFALGKAEQWQLTNPAMTDDAWDYVHITTWNFLPFVLRRVGEVPTWVVRVAFGVWSAGLALLGGALWRLGRVLANNQHTTAT